MRFHCSSLMLSCGSLRFTDDRDVNKRWTRLWPRRPNQIMRNLRVWLDSLEDGCPHPFDLYFLKNTHCNHLEFSEFQLQFQLVKSMSTALELPAHATPVSELSSLPFFADDFSARIAAAEVKQREEVGVRTQTLVQLCLAQWFVRFCGRFNAGTKVTPKMESPKVSAGSVIKFVPSMVLYCSFPVRNSPQ